MNSETATAGVLVVLGAGLLSGAFTLPSLGMKQVRWERVWLAYSVFAYVLLPFAAAVIPSPRGLAFLITAHTATSLAVVCCGFLFGAGSLLFGMTWSRLGIAVANAFVTGVVVLAGSAAPAFTGAVPLAASGWIRLAAGCAPLLASLALCAQASILRDNARAAGGPERPARRRPLTGLVVAALAGVLSAMLNLGFVLGEPLQREAPAAGYGGDLATAPTWFLALLGGSVPNILYTLHVLKRDPVTHASSEPPRVVLWPRCLAMACIWFGAIFLYGWGAALWGSGATVYGWAVLNGAGVMGSNVVGLAAGDWRGAPGTSLVFMAAATALQFAAFFILSGA